jgi:fluoroacetyl-CoA thioesterase
MIEIGASANISFDADESATAIALGSGDMRVLGTPKVVALCEEAAVAAVAGDLDRGFTTVGSHISLDHLAPTAIGSSVIASASVVSVEGQKLMFEVSVADGDIVVAKGTHTRFIVDRERFLARLNVR